MKSKFQKARCILCVPFISVLFTFQVLTAQDVPFSRGINLAYWFEAEKAEQVKFTKYTRNDFVKIKSLGCDVIRVPVHLPNMTTGEPDYTVNPLFFELFDQVVEWCDELEIYLILDNHSSGDYGTITDPDIEIQLKKIWTQIATHYQSASSYLLYEILNEPHDIDNDVWNTAQQNVLSTIRQIDNSHTIILSPSNWDDFRNLDSMYIYDDDNILYTFHFYEPHLFTAQGLNNGNFRDASGVPFPYSAAAMPPCPAEYIGTWKEQYWQVYAVMGTIDSVKKLMDIASDFASNRNVKIFCGEFGSLSTSCPPEDRVFWYRTLRTAFEERGIPWLIWDYHSSMGIFNRGDYSGLFEHDLNVELLDALGFNIPSQTVLKIVPDTKGFQIYKDYTDPIIRERSYTSGELNFYSTDSPYEGKYSIKWSEAAAYNSIVFGFHPERDLSWLAANSYFLSMRVKGDAAGNSLQVRFIDTKSDEPDDHPWRKSKSIIIPADNNWHQLIIPLSDFIETGSWDNNAWFDPAGKFDWKAVDQLEISTESWAMGNFTLYFDDIRIAKEDAIVPVNPISIDKPEITLRYSAKEQTLTLLNPGASESFFRMIDIVGRTYASGRFESSYEMNTNHLSKGIYILQIQTGNQFVVKKIRID